MSDRSNPRHCPRCLKDGKIRELHTINTSTGFIKNLCPSPSCNYPFCGYESLQTSIFRTDSFVPDDTTSTVDFLAEILDDARPKSILRNNSAINHHSDLFFTPSVQNILTTADLPDDQESLDSRHDPVSVSTSSNCLLPRYLADNMKHATTERDAYKYDSASLTLHEHQHSRPPNGRSCDSGISISSFTSRNSVSYEDHLRHTVDNSNMLLKNKTMNKQPRGQLSGSKSLLDHMLKLHQKRLK